MNAFERHNIDHLSPSAINLYVAEPALWVMERLLGHRSPSSGAAVRGRAVEYGIHLGLMEPHRSVEGCVADAEKVFDRDMALNPDPQRDHERANIAGYVRHGLAELRQYGVPTAAQDRVEIRLDDVPVPVEGYIDWRFDQYGLVVDLKTAERLPLTISDPHGRQGAVYGAAHHNYGMRFAYTKPTAGTKDGRTVAVYEMSADDIRRHLAALRQIAIRLGRFLALSTDPHELAGLLVPDFETFWWRNPIARSHGRNVYGF